jgi:hypothetical protein
VCEDIGSRGKALHQFHVSGSQQVSLLLARGIVVTAGVAIVQSCSDQNSFAAPSFAIVILAVSQALLGVTYRVYDYAFVANIISAYV